MTFGNFIFLDTETTSLNPYLGAILEVAAVNMEGDEYIYQKIQPTEYEMALAQPKALEINGYDKEVWLKEAIQTRQEKIEFWKECQKLWKGCVIVGSNPTFDIMFITKTLWDLLQEVPSFYYKPVDVTSFFLWKEHEMLSLHKISQREEYKFEQEPNHKAMNDAQYTRSLFLSLIR